ncbi:hypothetical protein OGAPHI_000931 [Ogataea philodendri]|uniref:Uncharacterized protein n=1 Tax=Ogataea philodendri TaxID=1378263 RepID=A0A9P8T9U7_9ASCO|nr:uncharacterized protein OGAPHI_000931 [Ogataea philodendri]KAH3670416.1 hypothetical protein OGAPHI_000931 [Ogataea philodendri]
MWWFRCLTNFLEREFMVGLICSKLLWIELRIKGGRYRSSRRKLSYSLSQVSWAKSCSKASRSSKVLTGVSSGPSTEPLLDEGGDRCSRWEGAVSIIFECFLVMVAG